VYVITLGAILFLALAAAKIYVEAVIVNAFGKLPVW